jgi:class 3 adenylate cyclase
MLTIPTGTVTFLFTDIEGSTLLLNRVGDRCAEILSEHQKILGGAFAKHNDYELRTERGLFFCHVRSRSGCNRSCCVSTKRTSRAWTGRHSQQRAGYRSESIVNQASTTGEPRCVRLRHLRFLLLLMLAILWM